MDLFNILCSSEYIFNKKNIFQKKLNLNKKQNQLKFT
jgi:hypothetical protein